MANALGVWLGTDASSITGGYEQYVQQTISSSVSRTLPDWQLTQTSSFASPVKVGWTYGMTTPYDGTVQGDGTGF